MKKVVIWGVGQGGKMIKNLLHGNICVTAYCDSNREMWGQSVGDVPIVSPDQISLLVPDLIFISMLNKEASAEVEAQIAHMGITADVVAVSDLRDFYDVRLATLKMIAQEVTERNIAGAVAELGVYQGYFAAEMNRLFPERTIYLFDTFEGFDERDVSLEQQHGFSGARIGNFSDTEVDMVLQRLPYPERAVIKKGYFPDSASGLQETFAIVSLDADLYQPLYEGLKFFYPLMAHGGYLIIHDYNNTRFSGAKMAVREFCHQNHVFVVPLSDLHGTAVIVKP